MPEQPPPPPTPPASAPRASASTPSPAAFAVPDSFDRSGTGSIKWATAGADDHPDRIPLGVADMDLPGFPDLFEALRERALHPVLGYTLPSPHSRDLVVAWYRDRFGADIDPDWIVQLPFGPRAAIRFVLDAVAGTGPPGPVLAPTPEYGGFGQVARAAGLAYEEIPLERTTAGQSADGSPGGYRLPVEEFEARAARSGVTAVVLSSPHNPTGRVWSAGEIRRLASAAASAGGVLISDEVHSDLVHPEYPDRMARDSPVSGLDPAQEPVPGSDCGPTHPVAVHAAGRDLAEWTVTVHSVGKTFNISGLAEALLFVPSPDLRRRVIQAVEGHGCFEGNRPLAALAQDVALARGGPWRDSLSAYLAANRNMAVSGLREAVPGLVACVPEASYLLWLDGSALVTGVSSRQGASRGGLREALLRDCGLDLQDGAAFGEAGRGFLRLNFALPRSRLRDAVGRLTRYTAERRGHRPVPEM